MLSYLKTIINGLFPRLLILLLFCIPLACKKGPIQYNFEGTITESVNNAPLAGVNVQLSQKLIVNNVESNSFSQAGLATTDNAGEYAIGIDRDKVTAFRFQFEKLNYFPLLKEVTSANISTENPNIFDEEMDAITWISFQITNNFPEESDHFKLITQTFREDCESCATNGVQDFYGPLDTTITYATTAGEYVKFIFVNVTESSSTFDSIYTTPFETIVYPIIY